MKYSRHHSRTFFAWSPRGVRRRMNARDFRRVVGLALMTAAGFVLMAIVWAERSPARAQTLPVNAKPTCTVTPSVFASWFQTGAVSLNGVVNPANSVTFPNTPNCSFYQWSEQMFLWLTSPTPRTYGGGGGRIFDSPVFYDVSPPDSSGNRHFIPHEPGFIRTFALRAAKVGPNRLPVIIDKTGRLLEVERPKLGPSGRQLILNGAGKEVEVDRATFGVNRRPIFIDKEGKEITKVRPIIRPQLIKRQFTVQRFLINRTPIFLDLSGNVVDVEEGQAGGDGVLEAQNGSLVYYAIHVNDVYAYFLTGTKDGGITPAPTKFPTSAADLSKITAFAAAHGKTFPDPNALAIEVKTSWVEAAGLPNLSSYVTMTATIPTYNKSNPNLWTPTGQKTVQLALVGMHVVGSTVGHPEMIWATFEHFGNTPNAAYSYINTGNVTTNVPQNTAGTWLFSAGGSAGPFNNVHMDFISAPNIESAVGTSFTISPSDTLRAKAWGAASDFRPNPLDASTAASNTEVISINNSVIGQLAGGDIRTNYFMSGSTWTIGGAPPTGSFKNGVGNEVGTSRMANSTMETYFQGTNTLWATGSNCFSCHVNNTTDVSHIYPTLQPLF